ncbi:MAG: hypothetical protein HDS71_04120 [Bacteroidales bacterium]|nr:hypothetical protein [Bacteroidales bacterium]
MKICGVVVTYYPEKECVDNIMLYLPWIDHLIIWENTPDKDAVNYRLKVPELYKDKVSYLSTGKNVGIAKALNDSARWAIEHGYTHLLTMDQDSKWQNFEYYAGKISEDKDTDVGAYAPTVLDSVRNISNFNSENQIITSGAVYVLKNFPATGPFCEEFSIDCVDTEYSFRQRLNGYKIKIIEKAILVQAFGNLKWVPLLKCYHANYSPFRIYHIARNSVWMWRMYRKTPVIPAGFLKRNIIYWYVLREPVLIVMKGKNKVKTLFSLFRGLCEGFIKYPSTLKKYIDC